METPDQESQSRSGSGGSEGPKAPTVTREKWRQHALAKLARGYVLIVGTERRAANFYLAGKGFEMCAYPVAAQLVKEGAVVEAFQHHLGTAYRLASSEEPR